MATTAQRSNPEAYGRPALWHEQIFLTVHKNRTVTPLCVLVPDHTLP